jgi:copper resistance protein B
MKHPVNRPTTILCSLIAILSGPAAGAEHHQHQHDHGDNPLLTYVEIDKLEQRSQDSAQSLDAQAWVGKDLHKLWLKSELSRVDGVTEEAEIQALYSRGFAAYWDIQIGLRHDSKPLTRNWFAVGVKGLAPYWFELDASIFVSSADAVAASLSAEYELHITQRLILTPEMELTAYGQDDPDAGTGSGLSSLSGELRLGYEISRKFTPYIGIAWEKAFGKTAEYAEEEEESADDVKGVIGIHAWF